MHCLEQITGCCGVEGATQWHTLQSIRQSKVMDGAHKVNDRDT